MKRINFYECSKLYQYFNVKNIVTDSPTEENVLLVNKYFIDADSFITNVKRYDHQFHRIDNLYTSFRYSRMIGILRMLKHYKFICYEEGIGTYHDVFTTTTPKIDRLIDNVFGASFLRKIREISYSELMYVYLPDIYKSIHPESTTEVIRFRRGFLSHMESMADLALKLSDGRGQEFLAISESKILIYITSWEINDEIISKMNEVETQYQYVFIKPHPHIRKFSYEFPSYAKVIGTNMMVQFFLATWIANGNDITVMHESSSSLLYFGGKVNDINFGTGQNTSYTSLYDKIQNAIQ